MSFNKQNYTYYSPSSSSMWSNKGQNIPKYDDRPYPSRPSSGYTGYSTSYPVQNDTYINEKPRFEVLKGRVTHIFTSFGYINDNIMFAKSDVRGPMVNVGDYIVADVIFQPNNPIKYKAERVSLVADGRLGENDYRMSPLSKGRIMNASPKDRYIASNSARNKTEIKRRHSPAKPSYNSKKSRTAIGIQRSAQTKMFLNESKSKTIAKIKSPKKSVDEKPKIADKQQIQKSTETIRKSHPKEIEKKDKSKSPIPVKSDISNIIGDGLSIREFDTPTLKNKYKGVHIPSQFFHVSLKYQQNFPLNYPLKLGNKCHFKVLDKKVQCPDKDIEDLLNKPIDPPDADSTFTAKVILLSMDELSEFYKQTVKFAEELDGPNKIPITKAIRFLVGSRGEYNEFAVGGRWSPSLDGENPEEDPQVLINTAIRTTKSMIGLDLSECLSWSKFLEFHYYRPIEKIKNDDTETLVSKGSDSNENTITPGVVEYREPHMETVVYYLPDVWNCFPTLEQWEETVKLYQNELANHLCPPPPPPPPITITKVMSLNKNASSPASPVDNNDEEDYDENEATTKKEESTEDKPTHYSKLNVDSMKVAQLKKELQLRKLNFRGVMVQLKARLKSAMEKEESDENSPKETQNTAEESEITNNSTESNSKLSENEKESLKKMYNLSNTPNILIHTNKFLQDNNLKFKLMSLHSLLSYHDEKLEEATFELAFFAKQFLQMIRRDAVFNLYKSIVMAESEKLQIKKQDNPKEKSDITISKRTIDKPLLFSCTIIDKDKIDNIPIEDMRNLFENLGICLSSSQLDVIFEKFKDQTKAFHYRNLTDKEMTDEEISDLMSLELGEDVDYVKELALGNKAMFESDLPMDFRNDSEEVERLKTQLDRSERFRQSLEIKTVEIRDETGNFVEQISSLKKELEKFREASLEYRNRYHSEKDRKEFYKRENDHHINELQNIQKKLSVVMDSVKESLEKHSAKQNDDKNENKNTEKLPVSSINTLNSNKNTENKANTMIVDDIPDGGSNKITIEDSMECNDKSTNNDNVDESIDNELSKPEDFVIMEDDL